MTYIGYLAATIIFSSVWAVFATSRRSWLVAAFWAAVMLVTALGAKRGLEVNGLCLCIAVFETALSIRATYGIIIWNQNFKDKGVILPIVIYLITVLLVGYCIIQIQKIGYVPNIMGINKEISFVRKLINIICVMVISVPPAYVGLLRFERFFSNKMEITLLNCRFYTSSPVSGGIFKGYYMYGVNNGVKYYFRITKRLYFMLRFEDKVKLDMYKDLRGNIFAVKNPCPKNLEHVARRDIRMAKNIAMSAVVYIIIMIIIL